MSEKGRLMGLARTSGIVQPQRLSRAGQLGAGAAYRLIRCLAATIRFKLTDPHASLEPVLKERAIYAIWHNRLALCLPVHERFVRPRIADRNLAALVSASRDGAFLAGVLELFHVRAIRGSSSRRGPQALLELTNAAAEGFDLAITPDGPRGPRYKVQPGVISLAQLTGRKIVPISWRLPWKRALRSWDQFQVPLPFSRCDVFAGEPVIVPRDSSDDERERLRVQLEQRLREITFD
jgi:lysophospholipid acyltransferase (LPLAT)-like uncharacterized protein